MSYLSIVIEILAKFFRGYFLAGPVYNGSPPCRWQPMSAYSGLCCRETNPKVSNVGAARTEISGSSGILHTACRKKFYCKPTVSMESICSKGVPFGNLNPPDVNNSKWGTPTPKKNRVSKIHFVSAVSQFAQFNGEIIWNPSKNGGDIARNSVHGRLQDKRKRLLPETNFCGVTALNWRLASVQLSSFIYSILYFLRVVCFSVQTVR